MYILILLFIYYGAYANVYCDIEKERERDGWYKLYIRVTTYTKHYNFLLPSKNMEQQSKQLWNVDIIPFDEILHIQQQLDMICIERLIYCNHNNNNNTKEFIDLKVKSLNIVSKSNDLLFLEMERNIINNINIIKKILSFLLKSFL